MPTFHYKALGGNGKLVKGTLDAADRKQALVRLRKQKLKPLEIQVGDPGSLPAKVSEVEEEGTASFEVSEGFFSRFRKEADLARPFFSKLLQLHGSGMPLGDAVGLMSQRMSDLRLKDLSTQLFRDLSEGKSLAAAMRMRPRIFDPALSYLVEAGEATGNVVPILENIITSLEQKEALRKKVISAMSYPAFIIFVAFVVVGLFLFFLLPRIETMLARLGGDLNLAARLTIGLADFALTQGPFLLVGLLLAALGIWRWRKTEKGRINLDRLCLKLPYLRFVFYNAEICRCTNILSILLNNGVNTTDSLRLSENTLQNRSLQSRFRSARMLINDGAAFSLAFKKYGIFPDMDVDILNVGENTGSMVKSFEEIYKTHSSELESQLKTITNLVAGLTLAFAFALVLILTLGVVLSILQLSQSMLAR